ncbi:MAG: RtcB family protein, partial [Armatimonadetes bacterium]|nr:RtcB family protein [Armatimonadota bacterium]
RDTLAEEAPDAYKDVDRVVAVCEQAGLSRKVARLRPLAVVKGEGCASPYSAPPLRTAPSAAWRGAPATARPAGSTPAP